MLIVYASKTGNIERFLKKTGITDIIRLSNTPSISKDFLGKDTFNSNDVINQNFLLLTYTTGIGEIPLEVSTFMQNNHSKAKGLIGSGNKNWGGAFCNATTLLSQQYSIPILMTFEMSGNSHNVKKFLEVLENNK